MRSYVTPLTSVIFHIQLYVNYRMFRHTVNDQKRKNVCNKSNEYGDLRCAVSRRDEIYAELDIVQTTKCQNGLDMNSVERLLARLIDVYDVAE